MTTHIVNTGGVAESHLKRCQKDSMSDFDAYFFRVGIEKVAEDVARMTDKKSRIVCIYPKSHKTIRGAHSFQKRICKKFVFFDDLFHKSQAVARLISSVF